MAAAVPFNVQESLGTVEELKPHEVAQTMAMCLCKRIDVLRQVSELMDEFKDKVDAEDQQDVSDHLPEALAWISQRSGQRVGDTKMDVDAELQRKEPDEPIFDPEGPVSRSSRMSAASTHDQARTSTASSPFVATTSNSSSVPATAVPTNATGSLSRTSTGSMSSVAAEPGCILQFSTSIYYAKEGDDNEMTIDVMRLGADQGYSKCHFATQDGDGKAGLRYQSTSGDVEFEPGETMKQITVPIIESRAWSSTLEFKVVLSEPEGCILGRYLYLCRVKVIDPDCFPTNKYEELIRANEWDIIPMWGLLVEYFKFNFYSNPVVTRRSRHQVLCDQVSNMYFILRLYISKVLVDRVVGDGCEPLEDRKKIMFVFDCHQPGDDKAEIMTPILVVLCCLMVVPFAAVHYADYKEVFFKIGGTSRKTVQGNLVRKFLNYDESARSQLGPSDLIMAITRDTTSLVHDGYMQLFPLVQNLGRLVLMVILQLLLGATYAVIPVFVYPIILISFLLKRNKLTSVVSQQSDDAQNELVNYVTQIMTTYRLIGDYQKRPDAVVECEKKIGAFNGKLIAADSVNLNNRYVTQWLSITIVGLWYVVGGQFVIKDPVANPLGTFLMNLQVFAEVGVSWQAIFDIMLKMQSALPYLHKIVKYMNLPIDLEKRMRLNRKRRTLGEAARKTARQTMVKAKKSGMKATGMYAADFVPISMNKLCYSHAALSKPKRASQEEHIANDLQTDSAKQAPIDLKNITMEIPQGTLVALVGLPGHGKSTLMRVIGGQLIPDEGDLLIPPHLRVLHISKHPMFFKDTLYNNLIYGISKEDKEDGSLERVKGICHRLLIAEKLYKYLDQEDKENFDVKAVWGEVLSQTQSALLSLCRAFIANPEVLVIHKPTVVLDDLHTDNTFKCLREYVSLKGLCMDPKTVNFRRPRTAIITTARPKGVALADKVFNVTPDGVIEKDGQHISAELLR